MSLEEANTLARAKVDASLGEPSDASTLATPLRAALTVNLAPITFSAPHFAAGRLPYQDEETYRALREKHRGRYVFRFDNRENAILNMALSSGITPLGDVANLRTSEHLLLLGKAIQQSLLAWLSKRRTILRAARPLQCWGKRNAALLSAATREANLEPREGLDVLVRHSFDTRVLRAPGNDAAPFLGLLLDINTSYEIDIPLSELIAAGFDPVGCCVCRRQEISEADILPRLETLGRVAAVEQETLLLTDTTGDGRIAADAVLLEPRAENLEQLVRLFYGKNADRILACLGRRREPYVSARGKFEAIGSTLSGIRDRRPLVFGDGFTATVGPLLQEGDPLFPSRISTSRPSFLFGPQGRETGQQPDVGIGTFGPYKYMQHERNEPLVAVICERVHRGRTELFAEALRSGFDDDIWRQSMRQGRTPPKNPFRGGLVGRFRLRRVQFEFEVEAPTPEAYRRTIGKLLQRLPRPPDLAIVQTRKAYETLRPDRNPYLASKTAFMTAGVPVQSVHLETMEMPDAHLAYTLNNLGLATYAKLEGRPFVISTRGPASHELVIGLGYSEVAEVWFGPKSRYVGITTVFQGDGRYLVWGQTREVEFTDYAGALLENLRSTIRFVREENNWQPGDKVRLVFHVYKPLKHREMDAIKVLVTELVAGHHEVEYAFLDISRHHSFQLFDGSQHGKRYYTPGTGRGIKGVGVPFRGECRQLSSRSALLQLIGADQVKTQFQGLPRPLLLDLHPESDFTDLTYLVRQVFHFSYLSWRSFFPAVEPVTILYSRLIANALGNLKLFPGWNSEVLTVGQLRNSMWFL